MLTGIVLTRDEAVNLPRCLASLSFCDRILIIDDASVDSTAQIARNFGAKVISHPKNNDFSAQRNFAMDQARPGWLLFVDADEEVSSGLAGEIPAAIKNTNFQSYFIRRIDTLWGKQLTHGDGVTHLIRLAQKGSGRWVGRVHETWQVQGPVGRLSSPLLHYPHPSVADFVSHLNYYSTLRAEELYKQHARSHIVSVILYPLGKLTSIYLIKLGLLDGTPGLISALMMSFYSFLVRGKLYLLSQGIHSANE